MIVLGKSTEACDYHTLENDYIGYAPLLCWSHLTCVSYMKDRILFMFYEEKIQHNQKITYAACETTYLLYTL